MRLLALAAVAALLFAVSTRAEDKKEEKKPASPLDFKVENIDGKEVDLAKYKGKVVLIVNVASKCGNTKQYKPLEKLYEEKKDQGLVILGFPANEFGKQEPGTNAEIKTFCADTYGVKFDMFSKIVVKGEGIHPLYKFLTSKETNPDFGGPIPWNFEKFLIGRDGKVVARYLHKISPDEKAVVEKIDAELAKEAK